MSKQKSLKIEIELEFQDGQHARRAFATFLRHQAPTSGLKPGDKCSTQKIREMFQYEVNMFAKRILVFHQKNKNVDKTSLIIPLTQKSKNKKLH